MIFVCVSVRGECVFLCSPAQIVKRHGRVSTLTPQMVQERNRWSLNMDMKSIAVFLSVMLTL